MDWKYILTSYDGRINRGKFWAAIGIFIALGVIGLILVPFIGFIWFIVECGILEGTKGANRYGPDPLA